MNRPVIPIGSSGRGATTVFHIDPAFGAPVVMWDFMAEPAQLVEQAIQQEQRGDAQCRTCSIPTVWKAN